MFEVAVTKRHVLHILMYFASKSVRVSWLGAIGLTNNEKAE